MTGKTTHVPLGFADRRIDQAVIPAIALVLVLAAFSLFWWHVIRVAPFDPIDFEVPQLVESRSEAGGYEVPALSQIDGPGIVLGDGIPTHGVVCNNSSEPVEALGSIWWERIDPRGARIDIASGIPTTIEPGCISFNFDNAVPDEVAAAVRARGVQRWRIVGEVTPTRQGGVTATWFTETFTLAARETA